MKTVILYHGTDVESALDILNNGLSEDELNKRQTESVQLGPGWYAAVEPDVAWFFATLAADALDRCTVVEMLITEEELDDLLTMELARREIIGSVPFEGEQIWFSPEAFDFLNEHALFVPHHEVD